MAFKMNDELEDLLTDNQPNRRLENWLWLYIAVGSGDQAVYRYGLGNREAINRCLSANPHIREELLVRKNSTFLPNKYFDWVINDGRQNAWLLHYIYQNLLRFRPLVPGGLIDRDLVIALIDCWEADLQTKAQAIENAKTAWDLHLQKDRIFDWFRKKEEQDRCSFAWEWIKGYNPPLVIGQSHISNYGELVCFFDNPLITEDAKALMVLKIKKAWSQVHYRKNLKDKKQYNFVLSDKSIKLLDRMAQKYDLTRAEIIEVLIKMEAESEVHLVARASRRDALLN